MLVGICDDDRIWEKRTSWIIEEYGRKISAEIENQYFPDKDSLLDYVTDVYRRDHIWFAVKEQFQEGVGEIFDKIIRHREKQKKKIQFLCTDKHMISLSPDDIYYLERSERKTRRVMLWGNYEIKDRLDVCESYLMKPDFLRCHNSYI